MKNIITAFLLCTIFITYGQELDFGIPRDPTLPNQETPSTDTDLLFIGPNKIPYVKNPITFDEFLEFFKQKYKLDEEEIASVKRGPSTVKYLVIFNKDSKFALRLNTPYRRPTQVGGGTTTEPTHEEIKKQATLVDFVRYPVKGKEKAFDQFSSDTTVLRYMFMRRTRKLMRMNITFNSDKNISYLMNRINKVSENKVTVDDVLPMLEEHFGKTSKEESRNGVNTYFKFNYKNGSLRLHSTPRSLNFTALYASHSRNTANRNYPNRNTNTGTTGTTTVNREEELLKQKTDKVMESLNSSAQKHIQDKEYDKAAEIYSEYTGDLANETSSARRKMADKYKKLANKSEEEKIGKKEEALQEIAEMIINGDFLMAYKKTKALEGTQILPAEELKELKSVLFDINSINNYTKDALKERIGKEISFYVNKKKVQGKLKKVVNDKFYLLVKINNSSLIQKSYKIKDIDYRNKILLMDNRMGSASEKVYLCHSNLKAGKLDAAKKCLEAPSLINKFLKEELAKKSSGTDSTADNSSSSSGRKEGDKDEESEKNKILLPPALAGYKLHEYYNKGKNRVSLNGKTVTITGMLEDLVNADKGKRLDLYGGKVNCEVNTNDQYLTSLVNFYKKEKKAYINTPSKYKDFLIKVTLQGEISKPIKINTVYLKNARIINWYGVSIYKYGKGSPPRFTLEVEPNFSTIPYYYLNDTAIKENIRGYAWQSQQKKKEFCLNINKKITMFMGFDPLSLGTEIHQINRRLNHKGYRTDLIVNLYGEVSSKIHKIYKNTSVTDWECNVTRLYPIQNYLGDKILLTQENSLFNSKTESEDSSQTDTVKHFLPEKRDPVVKPDLNKDMPIEVEDADFAKLEIYQQLWGNRNNNFWEEIPDSLKGSSFTKYHKCQQGTAIVKVLEQTLLYMAVTDRWGKGGRPGDWQKECINAEQVEAMGWRKHSTLRDMSRTWILYRKWCREGETFKIRTEKYCAPIIIVPKKR